MALVRIRYPQDNLVLGQYIVCSMAPWSREIPSWQSINTECYLTITKNAARTWVEFTVCIVWEMIWNRDSFGTGSLPHRIVPAAINSTLFCLQFQFVKKVVVLQGRSWENSPNWQLLRDVQPWRKMTAKHSIIKHQRTHLIEIDSYLTIHHPLPTAPVL